MVLGLFVLVFVVALAVVAWQHQRKPLPAGLDVATPWRPVGELTWLEDRTFLDQEGEQQQEHEIFDAVFELIAGAERLVVLDMFLVNDFAGTVEAGHRSLSSELVEALVQRRKEQPELLAVLITDPFNTLYGSLRSPHFETLREAGVQVIETDLRQLRDPNPVWSAFWRLCCQWFGNHPDHGWVPDPVGAGRVTLRSYLELLNFKANHRKTLVADDGDDWVGLVTSANPHDASSKHSNQALRFRGPAALDLLATEWAVAEFSGGADDFTLPSPQVSNDSSRDSSSAPRLSVITEAQVRDRALGMIDAARVGDEVDLAMFYLTHRAIVRALIRAHERGVGVRVMLDPNKGAFGREGSGLPNRQVALELTAAGVPVRWCKTRGEQCHSKYLLRRDADGHSELLAGSANFTRRNLDNFNLETNVHVRGEVTTPALAAASSSFDARWQNEGGRRYSTDYEDHADPRRWRYWIYRFMEASGLSTF